MTENYLAHYGVIGMKWGQHLKGKDYHYKSWTTKHNEKRSVKLGKKISNSNDYVKNVKLRAKKTKIDRIVKKSKILDSREETYAKKVSAGANIATRVLSVAAFGGLGVGSKPYQQYVAMMGVHNTKTGLEGVSTKKVVAAGGSIIGGRPVSTIVKQVNVRTRTNTEKATDKKNKQEYKRLAKGAKGTAKWNKLEENFWSKYGDDKSIPVNKYGGRDPSKGSERVKKAYERKERKQRKISKKYGLD